MAKEKEKQLVALIKEENLKDAETRHFIDHAFRDGVVKTTGTDIDNLMPPISRFGGGNRAAKKQTIIEKLRQYRTIRWQRRRCLFRHLLLADFSIYLQ